MEFLGGPLFSVAGAGESHGPGITTIVMGCPAGLWIDRATIQYYLDRRRPGSNKHGTPRNEKDRLLILSGIFWDENHHALTSGPEIQMIDGDIQLQTRSYEQGYTTGEPIAALVLSTSSKSRHYDQFAGASGEVRPGHTDLVKYHKSNGFVDYRGGGRSSYRSTISDVIGGSIARHYLQQTFGTVILSSITQVGPLQADESLTQHIETTVQATGGHLDDNELAKIKAHLRAGTIHAWDHEFADAAGELIKQTRIQGDSLGAQVEVIAVNVPSLVGEPLYNSLKIRLMGALGGLHAVQACEIGAGINVVTRTGSKNNDPIRKSGYQSNSHGGLIGGITTGMPIKCRVSFKPTATITHQQSSVRKNLEEIDFQLKKGRHDPCVGVRAGVTLESRIAIELMNAVLMHQANHVAPMNFTLFDQS